MFCPKCGSLMSPSNGKMVCNSCGYSQSASNVISGQIVSTRSPNEAIMIKEEKNAEPLDSDAVCPKCHHKCAYFLLYEICYYDLSFSLF